MATVSTVEHTALGLAQIIDALDKKNGELQSDIPITWRRPATVPAAPLQVPVDPEWPTCAYPEMLEKNTPNWNYGEVVFPAEKSGLALAGSEARIFIYGYSPFTLWVDGQEMYQETHAWHASGPIGDPVTTAIEVGRPYRLILCLEPTELPAGSTAFGLHVRSTACMEMAVEIAAAALQLRIAEKLAKSKTEQQLVLQAARLLDLTALEEHHWETVCASIAAMESALAPLSPKAKAITVHLIGHTHIDMDWMWTWPDTVHCVRRDAKAVTDMMDDYPELTFTHSQVPTYKIMQEMDPDVFAKVRQRIAEGRWENAAGTWVEGDLHMADGESIARHMLYASNWSKAQLGTPAKVLWEPDTFGHPGNMPQLAKLGELDTYFHWRCNPGRDDNWPARLWEGVDGTPVLAFSTCYGSNLQPDAVQGNILNYLAFGLSNALHIWGLGDHGGGIPRFQLGVLEMYRHKPLIPTFKFSTMGALSQAILSEKNKLKRNKGETYTLFEGCFTTHASIKRYNRYCETALLTAEALSAMAGIRRTDVLREAWTSMLFNHFHDIMDGAAVHDSYLNAHARAESSLAQAAQVTGEALEHLVETTTDGATLVLLNPLGFTRTEPVMVTLPAGTQALIDAAGKAIPVQRLDEQFVFLAEEIPAFSRKSYHIATDAVDAAAVQVSEDAQYFTVETAQAVARIAKPSGAIGAYYDKALGRELVFHGVPKTLTHVQNSRADLALNVFQLIDEAPNTMSAWLINDILKQENLLRGAEVTLVEAGPVFARFHVKHAVRSSTIEEDIIFYQQFSRVDFTARIDWRERGNSEVGVPQLKVAFGASLHAARARYDGPFCITERAADGQEQPSQKWADITGEEFGYTLYNDSKYGCAALGGRLQLTLLRNPYGPDPEPDNGQHVVRFAFHPHAPEAANAELIHGGMAFNRPPIAATTAAPAVDALPNLYIEGSASVVCTALRQAEHSDKLLLRLFETSGQPCKAKITLGAGITAAEEVNFLENPTGGAVRVSGGTAAVAFHAYEVKTLLVECAGMQ